ncbi:AraC family transcriptional regulator [Oceanicoccus sagamiensis]|nr:AraC family transcriptional regulator [Oceanicoccus sagamiensis]
MLKQPFFRHWVLSCFMVMANGLAFAQSSDAPQSLNQQVQDLKQQVIALNRDLFILEEELLFPANTQVAVFLSMNVGKFFALDAVTLKLDDKVVTNYLYTDKQTDALHRGGVQRLYLGNLKTGEHELVAVFTGKGPQGRDYRRGATLIFDKTSQAKKIELKIMDSTATEQPEFTVKEW